MLEHKIFKSVNSKDWVCFIHGAGGSSSIWHPQIRAFSKEFNVLVLDLRGHGRSRSMKIKDVKRFNFDVIVDDIEEVLVYQNIDKAHFVGISMGTIIIRCIAERNPSRILSMTLGGAVFKLSFKSKFLIKIGNLTKTFIPHMILYKIFASIVIPKNAYKQSRGFFINEAKKIYSREFKNWFTLTSKLNPLLYLFREKEHSSPTLYIMGEHDSLFLPGIKAMTKQHKKSELVVLRNSGHVVNLDAPELFNETTINFIKSDSRLNS